MAVLAYINNCPDKMCECLVFIPTHSDLALFIGVLFSTYSYWCLVFDISFFLSCLWLFLCDMAFCIYSYWCCVFNSTLRSSQCFVFGFVFELYFWSCSLILIFPFIICLKFVLCASSMSGACLQNYLWWHPYVFPVGILKLCRAGVLGWQSPESKQCLPLFPWLFRATGLPLTHLVYPCCPKCIRCPFCGMHRVFNP